MSKIESCHFNDDDDDNDNDDDDDNSLKSNLIIKNDEQHKSDDENRLQIFRQISIPLLVAGFGMVLAGILLDHIKVIFYFDFPFSFIYFVFHFLFSKTSIVFMNVPEIFILLPALLGLKGNLEMTMTSRLSSLANCGQLDNKNRLLIFRSNIALVQVWIFVFFSHIL